MPIINIPEGDSALVGGVYLSRTHQDLTPVTFELTVGSEYESKSDWQVPSEKVFIPNEDGVNDAVRIKLLVGVGAFMPEQYDNWLWARASDGVMVDVQRIMQIDIIWEVPEASPAINSLCWGVIDTACDSEYESYSQSVRARSEALAVAVLRGLTAGRVGGCPVTVRPCKRDCNGWFLPGLYGGVFMPSINPSGDWVNNGCGCSNDCSCGALQEIELPAPVGRVDQVLVDGVVLPTSAYRVDNGNRLVRQDGEVWPTCQDMSKPAVVGVDGDGTFSVTYLNSYPVDALGSYAAGVLASEFAKACSGSGKCRLPNNVVNIVRQGVTMQLTPGNFPGGVTGLREVDAYVFSINPNHLARQPSVWSPDTDKGVRVTTWSA